MSVRTSDRWECKRGHTWGVDDTSYGPRLLEKYGEDGILDTGASYCYTCTQQDHADTTVYFPNVKYAHHGSNSYSKEPQGDNPDDNAEILDAVETTKVTWLWRKRIPLGYVTILDGEPGNGKSLLTIDLASRVTTGNWMPDGTRGIPPAGVVLWSVEDGAADVIAPRAARAGADLSKITVRAIAKEIDGTERSLTVADTDRLRRDVEMVDAQLVVIDPMSAYLGKTNSHNDAELRGVIAPIQHLAEELGVAVLMVRHLNKAEGGSALNRGMGSIGAAAAARSVLLVAREEPDDPNSMCVLARVKGNLSVWPESLRYRIDGDPDDEDAAPWISWHGVSDKTANQLVAVAEPSSKLSDAVDFVRDHLSYGAVKTDDLTKAADREGITKQTLRRAKEKLGVISKPDVMGGPWMSSLPKNETVPSTAPF